MTEDELGQRAEASSLRYRVSEVPVDGIRDRGHTTTGGERAITMHLDEHGMF